jgi:hypothetical protein
LRGYLRVTNADKIRDKLMQINPASSGGGRG